MKKKNSLCDIGNLLSTLIFQLRAIQIGLAQLG